MKWWYGWINEAGEREVGQFKKLKCPHKGARCFFLNNGRANEWKMGGD